jgi:hypothetical protein
VTAAAVQGGLLTLAELEERVARGVNGEADEFQAALHA